VVCTLDNKDNAINTTIFIIKAIFVFIQNAVLFSAMGVVIRCKCMKRQRLNYE